MVTKKNLTQLNLENSVNQNVFEENIHTFSLKSPINKKDNSRNKKKVNIEQTGGEKTEITSTKINDEVEDTHTRTTKHSSKKNQEPIDKKTNKKKKKQTYQKI